MSLIFNEAALANLLESPDGPLGIKVRFVAETITQNYQGVIDKVWENQPAMVRPQADYVIDSGDFGLQAEIGMPDAGRVTQYMGKKMGREDWIVPAIMQAWNDEL